MKAATTSLGRYLDAHPELSCIGETHFFCCHYRRGVEWYRSQFAQADAPRVGEKTPHYLADPAAIDRMAELVPGARLIAVLRDPVDRAVSHYWHARRLGKEPLDIEEALAAEAERLAAGDADRFGYLERGRYLSQLQHVVARFPRDALHALLFEDLRDDPAGTIAQVFRFLGVDDRVIPPGIGGIANPYREHRPEWLWRLMFRRRLWRWLPRGAAVSLGRWMTREAEYPPLGEGLRRSIASLFEEENAALARWLGRDLSRWTRG